MSRRDLGAPAPGSEPVVEQKQRANIYTMMLILAFFAICAACVLLWFELQEYGPSPPWWNTRGIPLPTTQLPAGGAGVEWTRQAWTSWWA